MIELEGVRKSYERGLIQALNGATLKIEKGEVVSLMGPSGCGKSTLLNILGMLDRADSGELQIAGQPIDIYAPGYRYRREMVGMVFQFHHLIPALSLLENVMLPLQPLPIKSVEKGTRARSLLESCGLGHRLDSDPRRISGGERQRVAVVRALINNPRILLADEPTGSLDSQTGKALMDFTLGYCRERNITILLVTHDSNIARMADRVLHMNDGKIIQ
jgi:putative ABC transport system ATP-binding protein